MIKLVVEGSPLDIALTRDTCPGKRIKIDREILYAVDFQLFILLCCKVLSSLIHLLLLGRFLVV